MASRSFTDGELREAAEVRAPTSLRALARQLGDDGLELVRQELRLAKLELRESAHAVAAAGVSLGGALALMLAGGLALTAFLVIGLGVLLGDAYWASALVVGVVFVGLGGFLLRRGLHSLRADGMKPDESLRSVRGDAEFLRHEARELKRRVLS